MEENSRISIPQIAEKLGYSTTAIEKNIDYLKEKNYLRRCGNPKTGYWEVL
jgi:biotin operon repressor